ncbi:MAG: glycosyltransferase family 2 protein [Eubacteriales bacterium]|nr:glycosyltransferase family 2 protein [Eubacteriales bacterium]
MEEKIKVSVILPIHNLEKYLRESLEDVCGQTLREIEIICVNDGSTDSSEEIIREFMQKDQRIRLINQENLFAGAARNRGIEEAVGDYLICWDGDDRFDKTALEKLYQKCVEDDADLCICNAQRYDTLTQKFVKTDSYMVQEFLPETMPFNAQSWPKYIFNFATNVPWNKLYRRAFVLEHGLKYETRERANDVYFNMMARFLAEKITVVNEGLVAYRINNSESLTGTLSRSPMNALEAFERSKEDLEKAGAFENPLIRESFANRVLYSVLFALHKQTDGAGFLAMYDYLKNGGLEKLLVTDEGEGYYYKDRVYLLLKRIHQYSAIDYIMIRDAELMKERTEQRDQLRKEKNDLKNALAAVQKELEASRKKTEDLKKSLEKKEKRLEEITSSKGYKALTKVWSVSAKVKGKK